MRGRGGETRRWLSGALSLLRSQLGRCGFIVDKGVQASWIDAIEFVAPSVVAIGLRTLQR